MPTAKVRGIMVTSNVPIPKKNTSKARYTTHCSENKYEP